MSFTFLALETKNDDFQFIHRRSKSGKSLVAKEVTDIHSLTQNYERMNTCNLLVRKGFTSPVQSLTTISSGCPLVNETPTLYYGCTSDF